MTDSQQIITAADLEAMSPDQRADALARSIVTDLDQLPPAFRHTVEEEARHLSAELEG